MVIYVHFNRRSAAGGKPWTVHAKRKRIQVTRVRIERVCETVWKPEAKSNPRGFIRVEGELRVEDDAAVIY